MADMATIVDFIHHIFFPNRCLFCNEIGFYDTILCDDCKRRANYIKQPIAVPNDMYFERLVSVFYYANGADFAVKSMKFDGVTDNARKFAVTMTDAIFENGLENDIDIIIPVPMYEADEEKRGYNQSALMAKYIHKYLKKPVHMDILKKHKQTDQQHNISARERATNLIGAFNVNNTRRIMGKTILLVDDVYTTGTTLNVCSETLISNGAGRIYCVTAAKVGKDCSEPNILIQENKRL